MEKPVKIPRKKNNSELLRSGKVDKAAGYRVNGQKSVALLYTNNEQSKKEIKKTIPFTMPSERAKY